MILKSKVRAVLVKAKSFNYQNVNLNASHKKHYDLIKKDLEKSVQKKSDTSVVIHLYYSESWPVISRKLQSITEFSYDVFVSLPRSQMHFKETILKSYPDAFIYESPNRGRDVLPFMSIAEQLYDLGYKHVLKMHSKKSTHRNDGSDWFSDLINGLIPEDKATQKKLMNTLKKPNTASVGPAGNYTSLVVNFEANGSHMTQVVKKLYGKQLAHQTLQVNRSQYGFFAGTMIWLNLESIRPLFIFNNPKYFEQENGQIDATFAHAIERLLGVLPEINGWKMYELGIDGVNQIEYSSGDIPDWSGVYIGPQPK